MEDSTVELHVQFIPVDEAAAALAPRNPQLPPLLKGWTQPGVGDLIELAPGSVWRIVQRMWRATPAPNIVHLQLWIEPDAHPRHGQLPALASRVVTIH